MSAALHWLYAIQEASADPFAIPPAPFRFVAAATRPGADATPAYTAHGCSRSASAVHDGKTRTVERPGYRDISVA